MGAREAFDVVLAEAQERERRRLRRFRRRWIARHAVVLVVATWLVVSCTPALVDADNDLGPGTALAGLLIGGWMGIVAVVGVVGLVGMSLLAIPFAAVRLRAVLRTDDLAAFERSHRSWLAEALRSP